MIKCEISTQTDLHPMETNIVRSYEWNEWQLRRNAIKLVSQMKSQDVCFFGHSHHVFCISFQLFCLFALNNIQDN